MKILIVLLLLAIVVSLFTGLVFLIRDEVKTNRTVNSLTLRVILSALLLALLVISHFQGALPFRPSPLAIPAPESQP